MLLTLLYLTFCLLSALSTASLPSLSCKTDIGADVAWFTLFNLPKQVKYPKLLHFWLEPGMTEFQPRSSHADYKGERQGGLYHTIQAINNHILTHRKGEDAFELYVFNDDVRDVQGKKDRRVWNQAHSKGIFAVNKVTWEGVFIGHSFPRYPNLIPEGNGDKLFISSSFPENSLHEVQHMICFSFKGRSEYEKILDAIVIEKAPIYHYYPHKINLLRREQELGKMYNNNLGIFPIKLTNSEFLILFAKSPSFEEDIFENIYRARYGNSHSKCLMIYHTYSAVSVPLRIPNYMLDSKGMIMDDHYWKPGNDHSKWYIETCGHSAGFCDLNRQEAHTRRGGLCFELASWNNALGTLYTFQTEGEWLKTLKGSESRRTKRKQSLDDYTSYDLQSLEDPCLISVSSKQYNLNCAMLSGVSGTVTIS